MANQISDAVGRFLTSKIKPDLSNLLDDSQFVEQFQIKWRPKIPNVTKKVRQKNNIEIYEGKQLDSAILYLQKICEFYYSHIPIKDKKAFLQFCFHQEDSFAIRKFAMMVDSGYLAAGLVDNDQEVRELAQIVSKYELKNTLK